METKRKMKCECGGLFSECAVAGKFAYDVMKCARCGRRMFTVEQAKDYARLERAYARLKRARKVIRIGNALGVTLPAALREWNIKEGTRVSFVPINAHSIKLVLG